MFLKIYLEAKKYKVDLGLVGKWVGSIVCHGSGIMLNCANIKIGFRAINIKIVESNFEFMALKFKC